MSHVPETFPLPSLAEYRLILRPQAATLRFCAMSGGWRSMQEATGQSHASLVALSTPPPQIQHSPISPTKIERSQHLVSSAAAWAEGWLRSTGLVPTRLGALRGTWDGFEIPSPHTGWE